MAQATYTICIGDAAGIEVGTVPSDLLKPA